ncbi:MAG: C_GCAxxG_C_C family protein [Selenomonadaceae bacterium]|nr:C_GCAxxG_C_C family protein [Selenomonadaceae bacterium]
MSEKVDKAVEYMRGPYSCSQSVMCAFCDDAGISHDEAREIATPYAGGRRIKCGAVCAAELVLTAKYGEKLTPKLHAQFEKKFYNKVGAINCHEIKGHHLCSCTDCVQYSAEILDEMLTQ